MKKLISISLLFLFLYNTIGCYFVFKFIQHEIHEEIEKQIKNEIPDAELELISFKIDDKIDWKEKDKEFEHNNKMYDVVRIEIKKDSINYYCIDDKKEEDLFSQFAKFTGRNSSNSKKLSNILSSIFKNYYFNQIELNLLAFKKNKILPFYTERYKNIFAKINTPPPKQA